MKLGEWIESLLLPLTAVVTLLLDLADTFDWFHLFPNGSTSTLILLLSALTISTLAIIQRQLTRMREQLHHLQTQKVLESLDILPAQVNPNLRNVLHEDYFQDIIDFLRTAISEDHAPINDAARFRYYFNKMLQNYPKSIFMLTCPISFCDLWKDPSIEKTTNNFLRAGGKLKLVLIAQDAQEMTSSAAQLTLKSLQDVGAQYHVVNGASLPADLKKFFIVEGSGKISWELTLSSEGTIEQSTLSANKRQISACTRAFEKLWDDEPQKKRKGT